MTKRPSRLLAFAVLALGALLAAPPHAQQTQGTVEAPQILSVSDLLRSPIVWGGLVGSASLIAVLLVLYFRARSKANAATGRLNRETELIQTGTPPSGPPRDLQIPPAVVPQGLVDALVSGEAVAYTGSGLSAQSGQVTWTALLFSLLEELTKAGHIDSSRADIIRGMIVQYGIADATDVVLRETRGKLPVIADILQKLLKAMPDQPSESHRIIARMPFAAYLTINFDDLLDKAFANGPPLRVTYREARAGLDAMSRNERFILKLSGDIAQPASLLLGAHDYVETLRTNEAFSDLVSRIFLTRTLFFVGTSLQGIEDFLQGISVRTSVLRKHYALVTVQDLAWEVKAEALRARYGIEVVPVLLSAADTAVPRFLRDLRSQYKSRLKTPPTAEDVSQRPRGTSWLKRVTIKNVGPFRNLDLELDRDWNLLLGDNGVGKSTILKAIATALAGDEASPYAERIVRRDAERADIVLQTDSGTNYGTSIRRRTSGGILIESEPSRALDQEGWLAVGFPALRTITWERPAEEGSLGARRPTSADVMPLLSDKTDPRLDALKQRIVTLDHLSKTEQLQSSTERGHTRLLSELWDVLGKVIQGQSIRFEKINPQTREISVRTPDGVVPIESLSQGTISMLSWVGVLLQRLYEVTPEKEDPHERYAIVLIDEIDGHLHPAWQTIVVHSLKEVFPRAQFIATTHSPLVVRGMDVRQVFRFRRNEEGQVEQIEVPADMTMGRPDQVLAGTLFEVDADLDKVTDEYIAEYQKLLVKKDRDPEEEKKYRELERILQFRIPVPVTSPPDRRARELVDTLLEEHVAPSAGTTKQQVRDRAHALLEELEREQEKLTTRKG